MFGIKSELLGKEMANYTKRSREKSKQNRNRPRERKLTLLL